MAKTPAPRPPRPRAQPIAGRPISTARSPSSPAARKDSARPSRGCSPSAARPGSSSAAATRSRGERVASEISAAGCPTVFVKADLAKRRRLPQGDRRGGRALRPRRRARQRRRADRPRQHFRHHRGALQRDFRRQRARAVLPHPGDRAHHAAREDRGLDRQHPVDVGPWRAAVHHRLLRLEGRARHPDPQRRPFAAQIPHPRQRPQHRLDVDAGRGPHHEDLSRRQGRLARGGRQDASRSDASSIPRKSRAPAPFCAPTNPG